MNTDIDEVTPWQEIPPTPSNSEGDDESESETDSNEENNNNNNNIFFLNRVCDMVNCLNRVHVLKTNQPVVLLCSDCKWNRRQDYLRTMMIHNETDRYCEQRKIREKYTPPSPEERFTRR